MNKIDILREKQLMSYNLIAEKTGLTPAYICMLAKNKRTNPSLEVMQKIACVFGISVEKVFSLNEGQNNK